MYSLDHHLILGTPESAYPLMYPSIAQLPQHDRSAQNAEKRAAVWVPSNAQGDFQAPGVRDKVGHPSWIPKHQRTELYDVNRQVNVAPRPQWMDSRFKWALDSDWYRNSQVEWQRELYYTRTYQQPGSPWVDLGQWNHYPMRTSPIWSIPATSTAPFI